MNKTYVFIFFLLFSFCNFALAEEQESFMLFTQKIIKNKENKEEIKAKENINKLKKNIEKNEKYIEKSKKGLIRINEIFLISVFFNFTDKLVFFNNELKKLSIDLNYYGMEYYYDNNVVIKEDSVDYENNIIKYYKKGIMYSIKNNNKSHTFKLYSGLALNYLGVNNFYLALKSIEKMGLYSSTPYDKATYYETKAIYYYNLGIYKEAIEMLNKEEKIILKEDMLYESKINRDNLVLYLYYLKSIINNKMENYLEGKNNSLKVIRHANLINDYYSLIQGKTTLLLSEINLNNMEEATIILKDIERKIKEKNIKDIMLLYNLYSVKHDYLKKIDKNLLLSHTLMFDNFIKEKDPMGYEMFLPKLYATYKIHKNYNIALDYKKDILKNMLNKKQEKIINISSIINKEIDSKFLNKEKQKLLLSSVKQEEELLQNIENKKLIENKFIVNSFLIFISTVLILILFYFHKKHKKISNTDGLTKLPNKKFIKEKIDKYLNQNKEINIILFDIDYFKKVNDVYGHDIGDKVLEEIKHISSNTLRDSDIIARVGGEEFLILVEGELDLAIKIEKRFRNYIEKNELSSIKKGLKITISSGISSSKEAKTYYELIDIADKNLYKVKNSGRNNVFYNKT